MRRAHVIAALVILALTDVALVASAQSGAPPTKDECRLVSDCPANHYCSLNVDKVNELVTGHCVANPFFIGMDWHNAVVLTLVFLTSFIAAGSGGTGVGAVVVPCLISLMSLSATEAVTSAQAAICGGSLAAIIMFSFEGHPLAPQRFLFDLHSMLVLIPAVLIGVLFGGLIQNSLPRYGLFSLLLILSVWAGYKVYSKSFVALTANQQGPVRPAAPAVPVVLLQYLSPLPRPLEFRASVVTGYQQCDLEENGSHLPFILEPSNLRLLEHFVQTMPKSPQYLMICGPVKSGKSTILDRIVPGLIARHHQSLPNAGPYPVILSYSFVGHREPVTAAINFCFFLSTEANKLGLTVAPPVDNHLATFDQFVRAISQAIHDRNGMLVLLLDEIQEPLSGLDDIGCRNFVSRIKSIISMVYRQAKVGITGSGLMTMMHYIRLESCRSFDLLSGAQIVSIRDSPSRIVGLEIANLIVSSYSTQWTPELRAALTPESALAFIEQQPRSLNFRPAIFAYFCSLLLPGPPLEQISKAFDSVMRKVVDETKGDFRNLIVIWYQNEDFRGALFSLARNNDPLPLESNPDFHVIMPILSSLRSTASPGHFFPPYNSIIEEFIGDVNGLALIPRVPIPASFNDFMVKSLVFYAETLPLFVPGRGAPVSPYLGTVAAAVSTAIFQCLLHRLSIGVYDNARLQPIASLRDLHSNNVLMSIVRHPCNSGNLNMLSSDLRRNVAVVGRSRHDAQYLGLTLFYWIRCIIFHSEDSEMFLTHLGFDSSVLTQLFVISNQSVEDSGLFMVDQFGVPHT